MIDPPGEAGGRPKSTGINQQSDDLCVAKLSCQRQSDVPVAGIGVREHSNGFFHPAQAGDRGNVV